VLGVIPGSAAEYASLRVGDLLVAMDGKRFESADDLLECLDRATSRPMKIQFLRGNDTGKREVTIRLMQGVAA
jgi:S1-C subfamily serine protease